MDISNIDFGKKINLTDVEEGFCLAGDDWDQINSSTDLILVGRILGLKSANLESIKNILSKAWSPAKGIDVKQIGDSRFIFSFKHKLDLKRALENGPWSYEKRLIVLNTVKPDDDPFIVELNWTDFYVLISGLPLAKSNRVMGEKICRRLGTFKGIQSESSDSILGSVIRARVGLNITKPIPRVMKIFNDKGDTIVVSFRYERLPNFCYHCGLFDHTSALCNNRYLFEEEQKVEDLPYGSWLRAPNSGRTQSGGWQESSGIYVYQHKFANRVSVTNLRSDEARITGAAIFSPIQTPPKSTTPDPQASKIFESGLGRDSIGSEEKGRSDLADTVNITAPGLGEKLSHFPHISPIKEDNKGKTILETDLTLPSVPNRSPLINLSSSFQPNSFNAAHPLKDNGPKSTLIDLTLPDPNKSSTFGQTSHNLSHLSPIIPTHLLAQALKSNNNISSISDALSSLAHGRQPSMTKQHTLKKSSHTNTPTNQTHSTEPSNQSAPDLSSRTHPFSNTKIRTEPNTLSNTVLPQLPTKITTPQPASSNYLNLPNSLINIPIGVNTSITHPPSQNLALKRKRSKGKENVPPPQSKLKFVLKTSNSSKSPPNPKNLLVIPAVLAVRMDPKRCCTVCLRALMPVKYGPFRISHVLPIIPLPRRLKIGSLRTLKHVMVKISKIILSIKKITIKTYQTLQKSFWCTFKTKHGSGNYAVYNMIPLDLKCHGDCVWEVDRDGPCLRQVGGPLSCQKWQKHSTKSALN
ncbi:hypothetical protein ACJIZ3_006247 [Penstemon smallii]|uniref:DUF4283 domain-containing protein n=1 Tax=Penstemon smallii TaxID=265156 RepID=A0ABD3S7I2_9LAMI